ncbi:uncharacterized protein [Heterodontus francisci]|uniref:uncharacterized protein isoform X2 n=1 Tax=Heterodontus francisci TaxID=7792 RepID=UPI00355C6FCB
MKAVFCLICLFLSANGKQMHKNLPHGLGNGVGSSCELTEKAAIRKPRWQFEHNETIHFLGVILKTCSLENANCSKLINASLTNRVNNSQRTVEKPKAFTNSCVTSENRVMLTVLIPPDFTGTRHSGFKDQLMTMCSAAKGGLAPNIVWVSPTISMRESKRMNQQNATRTVTSNCKPKQVRNNLKNVTCLINHPTLFEPMELFVRCPFAISIRNHSHSVKAKKMKFIFNAMDSEGIIEFNITGVVKQINLKCSKQNDLLPEGIELIKNSLKFKGPMKESYAGKYVCVASYQRWKIPKHFEIEITSDENQCIEGSNWLLFPSNIRFKILDTRLLEMAFTALKHNRILVMVPAVLIHHRILKRLLALQMQPKTLWVMLVVPFMLLNKMAMHLKIPNRMLNVSSLIQMIRSL